jgi:hypothetical protein
VCLYDVVNMERTDQDRQDCYSRTSFSSHFFNGVTYGGAIHTGPWPLSAHNTCELELTIREPGSGA